jgi:FMN hydrolase / 5-amino-6-(5-phospho-D-ribitylamino)uracil phosphatase
MKFYRPLRPIKAITFDLDDTLYDNEPIIRAAEAALKAHLQQHHPQTACLSQHDWVDIKRDLISLDSRLASDMGQLRLLSLTQALSAELPDSEVDKAAKACFDCFYHKRSDLEIDQDIHACLAQLAQKVPLIAITNGNVNPAQIGIDNYFEQFLHASLKHSMKPAPDLFHAAIDHLGCDPKNILHVGDNLIKDVKGALDVGMQAAWYAHNRPMIMREEQVTLLPHLELTTLNELLLIV